MSEQDAAAGGEMRMPSVAEVVLSSAQLLITLAADAIGRRQQLDQAQLAIDAVDGLLPAIGRLVPAAELRQYRQALSELQLAYAEAAAGAPPPEDAPAPKHEPEPSVQTPPRPPIWTPGGEV
jgi:hypothetical protein